VLTIVKIFVVYQLTLNGEGSSLECRFKVMTWYCQRAAEGFFAGNRTLFLAPVINYVQNYLDKRGPRRQAPRYVSAMDW